MKKVIKDLKKYIWVIAILALVSVNSYTINANTTQCSSNTNATILLSTGVENLALSITNFARGYVKNREHDMLGQKTNYHIAIGALNLAQSNITDIKSLFNCVEINGKIGYLLNDKIEALHQQPTPQYLKNVTVFIRGKEYTVKVPPIVPKLPFTPQVPKVPFVPKVHKEKPVGAKYGTGVVVKIDSEYTYILTNKHVAGGNKPAILNILHNKKSYSAEIVKKHYSQDLALLKVKGLIPTKQVVNGLAFPEIGEKVWTMGHHLGRPFIYGEGVYSSTNIKHDIYQLPVMGGCSGSGVFNKHGELMGLVYCISGGTMAYSRIWDITHGNVVKGIYVQKFLQKYLK